MSGRGTWRWLGKGGVMLKCSKVRVEHGQGVGRAVCCSLTVWWSQSAAESLCVRALVWVSQCVAGPVGGRTNGGDSARQARGHLRIRNVTSWLVFAGGRDINKAFLIRQGAGCLPGSQQWRS